MDHAALEMFYERVTCARAEAGEPQFFVLQQLSVWHEMDTGVTVMWGCCVRLHKAMFPLSNQCEHNR